jgi:DNA-binding LacI/PurR family transcriptional regulator
MPKGKTLDYCFSDGDGFWMEPFTPLSVVDQLVARLRDSISIGELSGTMPGIRKLASALGVSSNTVIAAVEQLEREGFLQSQGHGCRSQIVLPEDFVRPAFRVTLLLFERSDIHLDYVVEIQSRLKEEGRDVHFAEKSLVDMRLNVSQIARMVNRTKTDAWVVFSSTQEILEWFATQSTPTFALFGRFRRVPLAAIGLDKAPAFRAAIRRLVELGHRRIVLLQPKHNRQPIPALLVRESLEEMEANGIKTGEYNIPDWEQSPAGLRKLLDALFAISPPTALILDRPQELIAAQIILSHKKILAPQDISLVCDDDPAFAWNEPSISCICWNSRPWVRRIVRWVDNVANGKDDRRQSFTKAKFVERGSIGPAPSNCAPSQSTRPAKSKTSS